MDEGRVQKIRRVLTVALAVIGVLLCLFGFAFLFAGEGEPGPIVIAAFFVISGAVLIFNAFFEMRAKKHANAPARSAEVSAPPASAAGCKAAYLRYMDEKGIKYRDIDDRIVEVAYTGENAGTIVVTVIFDASGAGYVHFVCNTIGSFRDMVGEGVLLCNAMNLNYRWVTFFLDRDNSVAVDADAIVDESAAGRICSELVMRMVDIVDKAYPEFMKVRWA